MLAARTDFGGSIVTQTRWTLDRAFTLIETLISIAVIVVLLGILLPTIALVRERGKESLYQSRMQSHARIFHIYAGDQGDWWPNVAERSDRPTWYDINGQQWGIAYYFGQQHVWHYGLAMAYYDGVVLSESFLGRSYRGENTWDNDYLMSASLLARPEYWNPLTRRGPTQWAGTRTSQVRFPGQKAILMEGATVLGPNATRRLLSAGADGAASYRHRDEYTEPYPTGDGPFPGTMPSDRGLPGMHTIDGVLGWDW